MIHFQILSYEIFLDIPTYKWNFIYAKKNVYVLNVFECKSSENRGFR